LHVPTEAIRSAFRHFSGCEWNADHSASADHNISQAGLKIYGYGCDALDEARERRQLNEGRSIDFLFGAAEDSDAIAACAASTNSSCATAKPAGFKDSNGFKDSGPVASATICGDSLSTELLSAMIPAAGVCCALTPLAPGTASAASSVVAGLCARALSASGIAASAAAWIICSIALL